jgi:hypothetical protein
MTAVLIVCMAGVMLFGYAVMCRLDKFMENDGFAEGTRARSRAAVLVYGDPELVGAAGDCLDRHGVTWQQSPSAEIPDSASFLAVIALSRSDRDNLAVCRRAKQLWPDARALAWCNDADDEFLYADAGVKSAAAGAPDVSAVRAAVENWLNSES